MLFERLEEIRQQPKEVRRRFAFTWSLIITGLIVLLWVSVLFGRSYALREPEVSEEGLLEQQSQDIRDSFNSANDFMLDATLFEYPNATSTDSVSNASSTEFLAPETQPDAGTSTTITPEELDQTESTENTSEI